MKGLHMLGKILPVLACIAVSAMLIAADRPSITDPTIMNQTWKQDFAGLVTATVIPRIGHGVKVTHPSELKIRLTEVGKSDEITGLPLKSDRKVGNNISYVISEEEPIYRNGVKASAADIQEGDRISRLICVGDRGDAPASYLEINGRIRGVHKAAKRAQDDNQNYMPGDPNNPAVISDRNLKHQIEPAVGEEILAKLRGLAISQWSYLYDAESVRHIGPMAQDFRGCFGLGDSETAIQMVDVGGVCLLSAQALAIRTDKLAQENAELKKQNDALRTRLDRLEGLMNYNTEP
jgi:hypothetical protein